METAHGAKRHYSRFYDYNGNGRLQTRTACGGTLFIRAFNIGQQHGCLTFKSLVFPVDKSTRLFRIPRENTSADFRRAGYIVLASLRNTADK